MLDTDLFTPRPTLTSPNLLARALHAFGQNAPSQAEIWDRLTQNFTVDLDAVAALMPRSEPEPAWLKARD
ncbi:MULTISPECIES: hypothetical protein [Methylobacterium]|uniref:Uncharacterized protein n=1 Tax=Methylobacterium thuringiense TaxID=1003091 RepID=A0ABQ4THL0_9HYPH|nr:MULTISPECIES: hypothetical protein [Methylobacterium]TXN25082.1 hypothetical protein FV217_00680 [Methylobacterium sp. WL9]GJE54718.1 hypothetical protein EKPJFOCH_1197 [Methylobacterium thuringiense]